MDKNQRDMYVIIFMYHAINVSASQTFGCVHDKLPDRDSQYIVDSRQTIGAQHDYI